MFQIFSYTSLETDLDPSFRVNDWTACLRYPSLKWNCPQLSISFSDDCFAETILGDRNLTCQIKHKAFCAQQVWLKHEPIYRCIVQKLSKVTIQYLVRILNAMIYFNFVIWCQRFQGGSQRNLFNLVLQDFPVISHNPSTLSSLLAQLRPPHQFSCDLNSVEVKR